MDETLKPMHLAFSKLVEALSKVPSEDINKMADNNYDIEIKVVRRRQTKNIKRQLSDESATELVKKITDFESRDAAKRFLETEYPDKKTIEQIARHLSIPIKRQDTVEEILNKIVEITVGARLRSGAIQGNLKFK